MRIRTRRWSWGSKCILGTGHWLCWTSALPPQEYHPRRCAASSLAGRWEAMPPSWAPHQPELQRIWETNACTQLVFNRLYRVNIYDNHTPTCQPASLCAASAPSRHSVCLARVVWWHAADCGCRKTSKPPESLCSAWLRGRAAGDGDKVY